MDGCSTVTAEMPTAAEEGFGYVGTCKAVKAGLLSANAGARAAKCHVSYL